MLILAHTGIAAGTVWLATRTTRRQASATGLHDAVATGLDYRLLFIGALLPDIIDKPLGIWLLADEIGNGRIFGHTLLFVFLLTAAGLLLYRSRKSIGLLVLAFGALTHLILDGMWTLPQTLFWPLLGWEFEHRVYDEWLPNILHSLTANPGVFIPEIIGALLLMAFFWAIIRQGKLKDFIRTGAAG